jgi:two-component system phosphate regulon response regulator OmpR
MNSQGCVLIVDEDRSIRELLLEYLGNNGYAVSAAADGNEMRATIEATSPDVVLLDIGLPGEDGLMLARYLRERFDLGIIIVTGSGDVVDRVVGLEVGADDYVVKPFDLRELRARIKSVMRRMAASVAVRADSAEPARASTLLPQPAQPPRRVPLGAFQLDLAAHSLWRDNGDEVLITSMEFDLLKVFVEHPNQVLSRDRLLSLTRNRDWEPFDRSIDIRIARLRRKLEDDADKPQLIRTVRGAGYLYAPSGG